MSTETTDTPTTTTTPDGAKVKREPKPRNVDYELEVYDELPERSATRQSPLEEALEKVKANEAAKGKWVLIGRYQVLSAGTAAKHVLEKRHGDSRAVEGWLFQTRRVDKDGVPMQGVFVNYDPNGIVEGAREQFDAKLAKHEEELKAKREAKKAEEAAAATPGQTTGQATTGNVPPPPPAPSTPGSKTGADADKAKPRAGSPQPATS